MSFALSRRQALLLAALTLVWGLNWPVMKAGIGGFPPLTFRTISMWLGLPILYVTTLALKVPLRIERHDWRELGWLTVTNMIIWYAVAIVALQALSSGRAAILGYTMPIFSAVIGVALFGQRLSARQWSGVVAAAVGVGLLLWHELGTMAGRPWAAAGMLLAAATWALGTQQMRRTRINAPTLAMGFWMTLVTTLVMTVLSVVFDHDRWVAPPPAAWFGIVYNAVLVFGLAQPIWLVLARGLPPIASTLSVMLIPVLGVASGAWWLSEQLHWQDFAAMLLMLLAIASVLWPARSSNI